MNGEMGTWVFDTMVSMTLLMALVLMLRKPVGHFFGPKIAYLLWTLPLARLFMPSLTVEAPAETVLAPILVSDLALATQVEQAAAGSLASIDWMMIAIIVWLGGAGLLFVSKLAAYVQFREDIISDGRLVGRHGNIKILETAAVSGPLAFGLFDKYIAVPADFFRNYAPRERELALDHEIAHHESGDLAANFAGLLILSLHWFNPVAWFSWIAFRQDQETACDARILKQSGHELRAVYGRTIAKSASGHQLGLASPLNQKDKIKGRLKMLGQGEKSAFRRGLGGVIVALGTAAALPLTATVVYAEAADVEAGDVEAFSEADAAEALHDDHDSADKNIEVENDVTIIKDKDGKEKKIIKIRKRKNNDGSSVSIDVEPGEGEHVRTIRRGNKTIVLHTSKPLSDEEIEAMIAEAEETRREAMSELHDHERELKENEHEMRIEKRELKRELEESRRELNREMRETQREVEQSVREAKREAREAEREARRVVSRGIWRIRPAEPPVPEQPVEPSRSGFETIGFSVSGSTGRNAPRPVISINHSGWNKASQCTRVNLSPDTRRGVMTEKSWAAIVQCTGLEPKVHKKLLLQMTLKSLKNARHSIAKQCDNPKPQDKKLIEAFDREIVHLKKKILRT